MSDDESDASAALFPPSPENEDGVTVRDSREDSRRESRRSHFVFFAVLIAALAAVIVAAGVALGVKLQPTTNLPRDPTRRAEALLAEYPVIDGSVHYKCLDVSYLLLCIFVDRHNDLAYELRDVFKNQLGDIDLLKNTSGQYGAAWQTDIPRLRAGHLGGQVGADLVLYLVYISISSPFSFGLLTCRVKNPGYETRQGHSLTKWMSSNALYRITPLHSSMPLLQMILMSL